MTSFSFPGFFTECPPNRWQPFGHTLPLPLVITGGHAVTEGMQSSDTLIAALIYCCTAQQKSPCASGAVMFDLQYALFHSQILGRPSPAPTRVICRYLLRRTGRITLYEGHQSKIVELACNAVLKRWTLNFCFQLVWLT